MTIDLCLVVTGGPRPSAATGTNLTLASVSAPSHGSAEIVDGKVRYVAPASPGTATIDYTVIDDLEQSSTATITFIATPAQVLPTNPPDLSTTPVDPSGGADATPPATATTVSAATTALLHGPTLADTGASVAWVALAAAALAGLGALAIAVRRPWAARGPR